ncbi:hypothetical protein AC480_06035 [miscellaneous Crenarchaeota group archaeon SMTZ1-55]|nr:MAG: hypothetical protein AC480_06035 [miscellaneous Crenarchaeota group archaeon SMTZ1-55]
MHLENILIILGMAAPMVLFSYLSGTGRVRFELRRLPMLDFVEDMIRAASERAQQLMFVVLRHICSVAARLNVRTIVTSAQPEIASVIADWAKEGYFAAGHPERFNIEDVYSFADGYHAEPLGNVALIHSQEPAGIIYLGQYNWNFCIMPMGAGNLAGVTQAALNCNPDSHTFASVLCSRTVTAHDTVAMGMYLKNDPAETAVQSAQDVVMVFVVCALWLLFALQYLNVL